MAGGVIPGESTDGAELASGLELPVVCDPESGGTADADDPPESTPDMVLVDEVESVGGLEPVVELDVAEDDDPAAAAVSEEDGELVAEVGELSAGVACGAAAGCLEFFFLPDFSC